MVSYTPVEYGKVKEAKLEIQTKEFFWNFLIKGTFPEVHLREQKSSIDNKWAKKDIERMKESMRKTLR